MVQRHLFILVGPMTPSQKYYNCAKYFHQILVISHAFAIIFIHYCFLRDFLWLNEHFRVRFHCDYLCTIISLKNWLWLLQFDSPQALSLSIKQSVSGLMKFILFLFQKLTILKCWDNVLVLLEKPKWQRNKITKFFKKYFVYCFYCKFCFG